MTLAMSCSPEGGFMGTGKLRRHVFTGALVLGSILPACTVPEDAEVAEHEEAVSGSGSGCTSGNVDCYRMYRPLQEYPILGYQHNFVGCVTCGRDPRSTVGQVYEDSWASPGVSANCWSNTVYGSTTNSCTVTVGTKIPCVGNMSDAYSQTEATFTNNCSWLQGPPGYQVLLWDTAYDALGATYPPSDHSMHTYLVNSLSPGAPSGFAYSYGHGRSNTCNCISWSSTFQSKLHQVNTTSTAPASPWCPAP
jgi:hypothetical protein